MKAWVLDKAAPVESRPLVLTDVPVPHPADDEVLVKVHACGICRTDREMIHCLTDETSGRFKRGDWAQAFDSLFFLAATCDVSRASMMPARRSLA